MKVEHDAVGHRFFVRLPAGEGQLLYKVAGPGLLNFWHTEVSPSLRGQGVGDAIIRAAMEHARQSGQNVISDCPFVRAWLKHHAEYQDLVAAPPA